MIIDFTLDGRAVTRTAHPCDRLSDILHDAFQRHSVRSGCQVGRCGSCIVLLDGKPVPSCLVPAFQVRRRAVVTYEGFRDSPECRDIERGFAEAGVETCGHCLPAKILSAHNYIGSGAGPDRASILEGLSSVACRCTEPGTLAKGVEKAMDLRRERQYGPDR